MNFAEFRLPIMHFILCSASIKATSRDWAASISPSFPLLFVSGQDDPIGDFGKGVMHTVNNLKADGFRNVEVKLYPEMRHEILNEEIQEEVLNGIYTWILKYS